MQIQPRRGIVDLAPGFEPGELSDGDRRVLRTRHDYGAWAAADEFGPEVVIEVRGENFCFLDHAGVLVGADSGVLAPAREFPERRDLGEID